MISVPSKDIEDEEAPFIAIQKMNGMIKSLINKIPSCKLGKWNTEKGEQNSFIKELPEDVDIVERCIHDYNRFGSPGQDQYARMNVFYDENITSESEIEILIDRLKTPRIQWMKKANSNALSPVKMVFSPDP